MMFCLTVQLFLIYFIHINAVEDSLVAVHLVFRHGDRCPEKSNLYKTSEYMNESYFKPYGFGQLTNKGKLTIYNLGKEIRQHYSGFLNESYNINLINARSSDFNRTKQSVQLLLAGLFPPTDELTWLPGFKWQPIPYNYADRSVDPELFCFGCPAWDQTMDNYLASDEGTKIFAHYSPLFEYISNKTEEPYDILKSYYLYFGFQILEELNYTIPDWAKSIYPYPLKNLTMDYYNVITATTILRQLSGGYLLKHILADTQEKIDGKIPEKKMFIWGGHENNLGALLRIFNVSNQNEVSTYGSYIALEVHNINETYGFKIFSKNDINGPVLLKLPDCDGFCPLQQFKNILDSSLPADDSVCTGKKASSSIRQLPRIECVLLSLIGLMYLSKI